MAGTMRPEPISTRREWIAELASREPKWRLTTLAHHIDRTWLLEAWRKTRKDGATGHSCGRDPRTGSFSGGLLGSMST